MTDLQRKSRSLINSILANLSNSLNLRKCSCEDVETFFYKKSGFFSSLRLEYKDGVALLAEAGVQMGSEDDLTTENERILGGIIKKKVRFKQTLLILYILFVTSSIILISIFLTNIR